MQIKHTGWNDILKEYSWNAFHIARNEEIQFAKLTKALLKKTSTSISNMKKRWIVTEQVNYKKHYFSLKCPQKQPPRDVPRKRFLKICSKYAGEHPCQSVISVKSQNNFIKITLWHGCSPVNLLHIFRTPFTKNTSERLLLCPERKCACTLSKHLLKK